MRPYVRSATGVLLMLGIIPVFAGLLACMPVPVGDPEKSRIDPELSGVWAVSGEGNSGPVYFLRPYDKRTWLIWATEVEEGVIAPSLQNLQRAPVDTLRWTCRVETNFSRMTRGESLKKPKQNIGTSPLPPQLICCTPKRWRNARRPRVLAMTEVARFSSSGGCVLGGVAANVQSVQIRAQLLIGASFH